MKNVSTIAVVAVILLIGAVGVYALVGQNQSTGGEKDSMTESEVMEKSDVMVKDDTTMTTKSATMDESEMADKYVEFSPSTLETAANQRRVLFFYANWCPTCRPADARFQQNLSQIPDDVTLIRVNYNDDQTDQAEEALAEKYGVTYQHTFVQIDNDGNEVTKWNGGAINELLTNIQ